MPVDFRAEQMNAGRGELSKTADVGKELIAQKENESFRMKRFFRTAVLGLSYIVKGKMINHSCVAVLL